MQSILKSNNIQPRKSIHPPHLQATRTNNMNQITPLDRSKTNETAKGSDGLAVDHTKKHKMFSVNLLNFFFLKRGSDQGDECGMSNSLSDIVETRVIKLKVRDVRQITSMPCSQHT